MALLVVLTLACIEPVAEAHQEREQRSADIVLAIDAADGTPAALSGPATHEREGNRSGERPASTARACACAYALLSLARASELVVPMPVTSAAPRIDHVGMPASPTLERQLRPPVGAA